MNKTSENSAGAATAHAVEVRGLHVTRGKNVVFDGLELDIPRGQITGLMGPSGCGKTTLMRSIVGVQKVAGRHRHRARRPRRLRGAAPSGGLRHAGRLGVRRPHDPPEPRLLRPAHRRAGQRRRTRDRRDRPRRQREADRRFAQRRSGEPRLAGGRDARLARADGARRTDGRAGPAAAQRAVGTVPCARRPRHHAHRQQPRDGRGPALRPPPAHACGTHHRRHDTGRPPRRHGRGRPGCRIPRAHRAGCDRRPIADRGADGQHPLTRRELRETEEGER